MNRFHRWYCRTGHWRHTIQDQIVAMAAGVDTGPRLDSAVHARRRRRRIRRVAGASVSVALAILLVPVAVFALNDGDDGSEVAVQGPTTPTASDPMTPTSTPQQPVGWREIAVAPIEGRWGHTAVWSGDRMFVWGGQTSDADGQRILADGALYDPTTDEWELIAPAPIAARSNAIAVWTGTEVLIWGGSDLDGSLFDGAAYDPATDTWRAIESKIFGAIASVTAATWTGDELVLVGVSSLPAVSLGTNSFALDPSSGTSRALPFLVPDAGQRVAGWDGSAVYVATIADSQPPTVHRLESDTTAWVSSEPSNLDGLNVDATTTVWTGNSFIFTSNTHNGAIYDIGTETWTAIPPTLSSVRLPAVWTGTGVTVGDRLLDPNAGEWEDAAPPPEPYRWPASAVWTGTEYVVWGGDACGRTARCGILIDPEHGAAWAPAPAVESRPAVEDLFDVHDRWIATELDGQPIYAGASLSLGDELPLPAGANGAIGGCDLGSQYPFTTDGIRVIVDLSQALVEYDCGASRLDNDQRTTIRSLLSASPELHTAPRRLELTDGNHTLTYVPSANEPELIGTWAITTIGRSETTNDLSLVIGPPRDNNLVEFRLCQQLLNEYRYSRFEISGLVPQFGISDAFCDTYVDNDEVRRAQEVLANTPQIRLTDTDTLELFDGTTQLLLQRTP